MLSANKALNNEYTFSFNNVQSNTFFWLSSDYYFSGRYELIVIPKPVILQFDIAIDYPSYTNKPDVTIENNGDLIIPEGSILKWSIYTRDANGVCFRSSNDSAIHISRDKSNVFTIDKQVFKSCNYWMRGTAKQI